MLSFKSICMVLVFASCVSCGQFNTKMKIWKKLTFPVAITSIILSGSIAVSANSIDGEKLFVSSCAGCHAGGGNIVPFQGSKTLQSGDLKKNGYDNVDKIVSIIKSGKAMMPAYGELTSPKGNLMPAKFTDKEMTDIAQYVLGQAENGWQ